MFKENQNSELLTAAIGGDKSALERLLLTHYSSLEKYLISKMPPTAARHFGVDDILQEVLTQVFRDIGRYEQQSKDSFVTWLRSIADHRLVDALRKMRAKKRGGSFQRILIDCKRASDSVARLVELVCEQSHTASSSLTRREMESAIHIGIASLPDDQRDVIWARFFEEKNVSEIAIEMRRSPGAIRGLVYRAQKNLAAMMGHSSQWLNH